MVIKVALPFIERQISIFLLAAILSVFVSCIVSADTPPPEKKWLFREDSKVAQDEKINQRKKKLIRVGPTSDEISILSESVEANNQTKIVKAIGAASVDRGGVTLSADNITFNNKEKKAILKGPVQIVGDSFSWSGRSGKFNLSDKTGTIKNSTIFVPEIPLILGGKNLSKTGDNEFEATDCIFSTCSCSEDLPWNISADKVKIVKNGYAQIYDGTLKFYDVPIFYAPYFIFPVKDERQSGFLFPELGFSSKDGVRAKTPYFWVIDPSSDITISPSIQTKSRKGVAVKGDVRLSERDSFLGNIVYSDDRQRDGSLRGIDADSVFNSNFKDDRVAVGLQGNLSSPDDWEVPTSIFSDIHYINDDLVLRELDAGEIGDPRARFLTSTVAIRSYHDDWLNSELITEYTQSIVSDDDLVFQRLPEYSLVLNKRLRVNEAFSIVPKFEFGATQFRRDIGDDGRRFDLRPSITLPFRKKNYFSGALQGGIRKTLYNRENIDSGIDEDPERSVSDASLFLTTSVERVYELDEANWFTSALSYGERFKSVRLKRLKHTIEPITAFQYIPDTTQDTLPFYDQLDRIREKSALSYGFRTRLLGRFEPLASESVAFPETVPEAGDIPRVLFRDPLFDHSTFDSIATLGQPLLTSTGYIREIASIAVLQSYDFKEERDNNDPLRDSLSDLKILADYYPTDYFGVRLESTFNVENGNPSSWGIGNVFIDDRGDALRSRFSYIEDALSQIEGNLELVVTDRVSLGSYIRFDELNGESIDKAGVLRFYGGCRCWHIDLGVEETLNPDKSQIFTTISFGGLRGIGPSFSK